ncbi:MAG: hypothetical protein K0V04_19400 [Deltaproteobacteria bacterium]|nr:hypothetical protein [Deltaproteobacteria bacterium]
MDDPENVGLDEANVLSHEQRVALAEWSEGEPSAGFADAVMAAWARELEPEAEDAEHGGSRLTATATRPTPRRRNLIGLVAGLAAAAAVLLLVQALPRASAGVSIASGEHHGPDHQCEDHAAPGPVVAEPMAVPASFGAQPDARMAALGDGALAVLTTHCMPCHDSQDPDAKDGALRVYDTRQSRWWQTMSDDQLREATTRVEELGVASDDQRRSMAAFVEAELSRRARAG